MALIPCRQPGERYAGRKLEGKRFVDLAPGSKHRFIEGRVCTDAADRLFAIGKLANPSTKNAIHRNFFVVIT